MKTNKSEPSIEASKVLEDVKTNVQYQCWDKQQGNLITVVAASGVRWRDHNTGIYREQENLSAG